MVFKTVRSASLLMVIAASGICATASAEYPIAGVNPDQRPAGAPVITQVQKPKGWYSQALTGVSRPYPPSLRFLEDQGNWYTPFNRPGVAAPYDIRGWRN
jgi:hypothetical protein